MESGAVLDQTDGTKKIQRVVRDDVAASGDTLAALGAPQLRALDLMKNRLIQVLVACSLSASAHAQNLARVFVPKAGFVPNEETAIRIAVAVWEPIYGKDNIAREKPYTATLEKDVWFVNGSVPKGAVGGSAFAAISKKDGTVMNVFHGK